MTSRQGFFALASAVTLSTGCSAATPSNALPQSPSTARAALENPAARSREKMTLRIHVPRRVRHRNHYVSPETQSLALAVVPGAACATCSGPQSANTALTPNSPNCAPLNNGTTCTITLVLSPGHYIGSISTYDGSVGCQNTSSCNTLSANQSFPFQIAAGKANSPSIALYGVPKFLQIVPASKNISVNATCLNCLGSISIPGINSTAKISLYGLDADSNLILGPGSPSFALPAAPPLGWTATVRGNVVTFTTGSTFKPSTAFPQLEIDMQSPACSETGATCKFETYPAVGTLIAVADQSNGAVHVLFGDPYRQQTIEYATVRGVNPQDVKFDDNTGDLIVANSSSPTFGASTVNIYAPPYTGPPATTFSVNDFPTHLAVDQAGDIAVSGHFIGSSVQVFAAPSYASPTFIGLSSNPTALAFEYAANPKLWVAVGSNVAGYAYPYTGSASPNVSAGTPAGLDIDPSGNLWVADATANTVTEYTSASAYSAAATATNLSHVTSVDVGNLLNVCASETAYSYFEAGLQLSQARVTSYTAPCFITSGYLGGGNEVVIAAGTSGSASLETFNSYYALLPYSVGAIAVYPSHRLGS